MEKLISHRLVIPLSVVFLLFGCGSKQPTVDTEIRQQRSQNIREQIAKDTQAEPISGTLTLSTAIARSIKFNLDHKVKQMETAVAQKHLELARMSYLPEITASAGYSERNNEAGAISRSLKTGEISLEYSTSQEKSHSLNTLRASWDVVDFGLTYFTVKQKTNEIAIAEEQRRKVIQNIIQDVQEAYWRAYIAQELSKTIDDIASESSAALTHYKSLADAGKIDPKESLGQQSELLQIRYNMRSLQEQLAQGRLHLNALIDLPPGSTYVLAPVERKNLPKLSDANTLEMIALMNRPELRMEDNKSKINKADAKKAIIEMFPHLQFWGQVNDDSNEYLYNGSWGEVGVQVTWNLLRATNAFGRKNTFQAEDDLAEARHKSLSMAIITQVNLALNRYAIAQAKYQDVSELEKVRSSYADLLRRDTLRQGASGYAKIHANLQATATKMESMLSYAELQNSLMRIYNTLGLDPLETMNDQMSIPELTQKIDQHFNENQNVQLFQSTSIGTDRNENGVKNQSPKSTEQEKQKEEKTDKHDRTLSKIVLPLQANSLSVVPATEQELDTFLKSERAKQAAKFEVRGYVSSTDNSEDNVKLSHKRAEAIKALLLTKGISDDRISVKGMGNQDPIASNETSEGREKNRRVEVEIIQ